MRYLHNALKTEHRGCVVGGVPPGVCGRGRISHRSGQAARSLLPIIVFFADERYVLRRPTGPLVKGLRSEPCHSGKAALLDRPGNSKGPGQVL
jgi:hypothetical protein